MHPLVIVTGPPGAGKSTVAQALADRFDHCALVRGDDFFAFVHRGLIPPWLPEAHAQNELVIGTAAAAACRLSTGYPVIYDGIMLPWGLGSFAPAGPRPHYVVLLPSMETCRQRVGTRTGHGFTDQDAAARMYRDFEAAAVDRRHLVTDSAASADTIAAAIHSDLGPFSRPDEPAPPHRR